MADSAEPDLAGGAGLSGACSYGGQEDRLISEHTELILRRMPAAAITETERTLLKELSQSARVQELLEDGETGDLKASEHPDIMAVLERYLDREQAADLNISVTPPAVLLSLRETEKGLDIVQISGSGDAAEFFKVYSRDGWFGTRSVYENWDNERVRQSLAHHGWFSWLLNA